MREIVQTTVWHYGSREPFHRPGSSSRHLFELSSIRAAIPFAVTYQLRLTNRAHSSIESLTDQPSLDNDSSHISAEFLFV